MSSTTHDILEATAREEGIPALFEKLCEILRAEKRYSQLFDARLMRKRHEVGLPVEGAEVVRDLPENLQIEVENYYVDLCRTVGGLFLSDGDIAGAWPYFRAIDEPGPVARALDDWRAPGDPSLSAKVEVLIDIALKEGANPAKGIELVLALHGLESALGALERHVPRPGDARERAGRLLVDRVYGDLVAKIRAGIAAQGGAATEEESLRDLIAKQPAVPSDRGQESVLRSAIHVASSLQDRRSIQQAVEIAEYGRLLPRDDRHPDPAPFEDFYADSRIFLLALLGEGVDGAVRYFRRKAERAFRDATGKHVPGEVLVSLLDRVGRHSEAIEAHVKYLGDSGQASPTVPRLLDLCERAGDYSRFLEKAREKGDLLEFVLGLVRRARPKGVSGATACSDR